MWQPWAEWDQRQLAAGITCVVRQWSVSVIRLTYLMRHQQPGGFGNCLLFELCLYTVHLKSVAAHLAPFTANSQVQSVCCTSALNIVVKFYTCLLVCGLATIHILTCIEQWLWLQLIHSIIVTMVCRTLADNVWITLVPQLSLQQAVWLHRYTAVSSALDNSTVGSWWSTTKVTYVYAGNVWSLFIANVEYCSYVVGAVVFLGTFLLSCFGRVCECMSLWMICISYIMDSELFIISLWLQASIWQWFT